MTDLLQNLFGKVEGIIDVTDTELFFENANKDIKVANTQRDMLAGELSKLYCVENGLLSQNVIDGIKSNAIKFHDLDYFVQKIHNCCIVNLKDMLDNGTVLNRRMIDSPTNFQVACTVTTQIVAAVASGQYGGTSISITPLAKYLRKTYKKALHEFESKEIARKIMINEMKSGIQTLNYQLNTLTTTNGQAPFSTLFLYLNEDTEYIEEVAMMIQEIFIQRMLGIKDESGHYTTYAFPKLIYVLDENNIHPDSTYFYLTELAAKCTQKRMNPDFISAKIMKQNYQGNVFPAMGCRSFLNPWKNPAGEYQFTGRLNMGVVTLNLPQIAILSNGDLTAFNTLLNEKMLLVKEALMAKFERFASGTSDVSPIHFQHGAISRLPAGASIRPVVTNKYATLAVGYIGVYECAKFMTGKSSTQTDFAVNLIQKMREICDFWNSTSELQFSLYGTPSESTAGKMCELDKARFGVIPDVTDKGWYTNSFHVDVREKISAFDKLKYESQFQKFSSGGNISYVEIPNMANNQALIDLLTYIYDTTMYAEFNTKSDDFCRTCKFEGEILLDETCNWRCPNCGETQLTQLNVIRRTCGYIGENFWNEGKTREIKQRLEHVAVADKTGIVDLDYANGEGLRTTVWYNGCPHKCPGCHNSHLFKFTGLEIDHERVVELNKQTGRVSILGGEPLAEYNVGDVLKLVKRLKEFDCQIFIWSGYEKSEIKSKEQIEVISLVDKVVFGRFEIDKKVVNSMYGSSNQYVLSAGEIREIFAE